MVLLVIDHGSAARKNDRESELHAAVIDFGSNRSMSFAGFPPGLPPMPADAPHLLSAEAREAIAQAVVAGKPAATHAADLREARWAVDAIDTAFARGALDIGARRARNRKAAA